MKPKRYILPVIALLFTLKISATSNVSADKIHFYNALDEVKEMLEGKREMDFERAVFVIENTYWDNLLTSEEKKGLKNKNFSLYRKNY